MLVNRCCRCLRLLRGDGVGKAGSSFPGSAAKTASYSYWSAKRGDEYAERKKIKESTTQQVKIGMKMLGGEVKKMGEEVKEKFTAEPITFIGHGDYEILYKFDNKESVSDWIISTDKDMGEGKSQAEFLLGPNQNGVFRGFLNTEVPKDGIVKNAGYCNIRSPSKMRSFKRVTPHDLSSYNCVLVRLRGDGRPYQLMLSMDRYFDIQWHDQYTYTLFTRGGPYWQFAKIPFSKFFLSSKGRIQDSQEAIQLNQVTTFGITAADGNTGPFQLEIDFIGVVQDARHVEEFAYEMYETSGSCLY